MKDQASKTYFHNWSQNGDIILQIKYEDNVKEITKLMEGVENIEKNGKLTHSQTSS
jgi:hypothetical protein